MKTALISTLTPASSSSPAVAPAPGGPQPPAGPGRPTALTRQMVEMLCAIIRETGASDSVAAAQAALHPSTISRWKRDCPDLVILLRSAREEFRSAHLAIILNEARAGGAAGFRAATWLLERVFPEDYSPRAKERALFQERYDAVCASELEGSEVALPNEGEPLQNVKNSPERTTTPGGPDVREPEVAPARSLAPASDNTLTPGAAPSISAMSAGQASSRRVTEIRYAADHCKM